MVDNQTATCIRIAMEKANNGEGMSTQELADKLNVTRHTVTRYRKHGCDSMSQLGNIAKACGLTYTELMVLGG